MFESDRAVLFRVVNCSESLLDLWMRIIVEKKGYNRDYGVTL